MKRVVIILGVIWMAAACDSDFRGAAPTGRPASPEVPAAPKPIPGPAAINPVTIVAAQQVNAAVEAADPDCFPDWDARGRCRAFQLTAAASGMLVARLTGTGPSRGMNSPEIFIVAADGSWTWSGEGWPERQTALPATAGLVYRVVVISYGPFPDAFALLVDVQ